jgi:hypothetical protein
MKPNVGGLDRALRIVIGLALIVMTLTGTIGVWGWIGVIVLATGVFRFCGLYSLIGVNTCKIEGKSA